MAERLAPKTQRTYAPAMGETSFVRAPSAASGERQQRVAHETATGSGRKDAGKATRKDPALPSYKELVRPLASEQTLVTAIGKLAMDYDQALRKLRHDEHTHRTWYRQDKRGDRGV